ncbi:MAG: acyl-CoA dehydrogenase family protein [Candidatus Omnitrophica bacterium]|nr:acyl-CoA dehydrogenase family protein [Candidatus Omnitrophota bacterium]
MYYHKIPKGISLIILSIFIFTNTIYGAADFTLRVPLSSDADLIEGLNSLEVVDGLMEYLGGEDWPGSKEHAEEFVMLKDTVEDFIEKELADAKKWEEEAGYAIYKQEGIDDVNKKLKGILDKLAGLGILGISVPEEYGGFGLSHYYTYRIIEMLASVWPSLAVTIGVNFSAQGAINKFGTEDQKNKFLKKITVGTETKTGVSASIAGIGITEPDAGSDAMKAMKTYARKDGNGYVLNGTKTLISSIKIADVYIVFAVTDKEKGEISAFLVEEGTKGFSTGKPEAKMGQKASFTGELKFEDCRIPKENMLGRPGQGRDIFNEAIGISGRISIASLALGITKEAYKKASERAEERKPFGRPVSGFEEPRDMLDDMKLYIAASEMFIRYASYLKDKDSDKVKDIDALSSAASMSKLFSSEKGQEAAIKAMDLHGGYGYMVAYEAERFLRDAKVTVTYEGTSQIQKLIIKKHMPLFLNSEIEMEKAIDSYLSVHSIAPGYRQIMAELYGSIGDAQKRLREFISEKKGSYRHAEIFVDYFITKLMLLKAIFLASQGDVPEETVAKSLEGALLASRFLRDSLARYENYISTQGLLEGLRGGLDTQI